MTERLTDERLTEIRTRLGAATPGPWHWRNTQEVYLVGAQTRIVMAFERMGMQGAQPSFRDSDNLLWPAGRENLNAIPDATLIAHAPADIADLLAEVERLRRATTTLDRTADELAGDVLRAVGERDEWKARWKATVEDAQTARNERDEARDKFAAQVTVANGYYAEWQKARDAVEAVLAVHRPLNNLGSPPCAVCLIETGDDEPGLAPWPCETVRAITATGYVTNPKDSV